MDFFFLFLKYSNPDWPSLARGGRTVCMFVGILNGVWDLMVTFSH